LKHPKGVIISQLILVSIVALVSLFYKPTYQFSGKSNVLDSLFMLILLLFVMNILLGLLKEVGMKLLLSIFYFLSITYFLYQFTGYIAPLLALILISIKFKVFDVIYHDLLEMMTYIGFVWLLTPALPNVWMLFGFAIALAIYDFISVFKTKHMISLLKLQMKIGAPTALIIPYSKHKAAILGGGDVIITALLTVGTSRFGILSSIATLVGACIGILVLQIFGKKKKVYPALPTIVGFALLSFALSLLFQKL